MVETFDRHWPRDVKLYLYAEGFAPDVQSDRIEVVDLLDACPGLVAFKQRHRNNPQAHGREARGFRLIVKRRRHRNGSWLRYKLKLARVTCGLGYRWDAVRFSHKSFAVFDASRRCGTDVLCWLDSDVVVFDDIPRAYLDQLLPSDCLLAYLKRPSFSECGFLAYNLRHPKIGDFFADFERLYTRDELFREQEYHDSWLFDVVRRRFEKQQCKMFDIAEGMGAKVGHVFINSSLGRYMDHLKGDRTADGTSSAADLLAARPEPYWRRVSLSPRATPPAADGARPARPAEPTVWASPRPGSPG